jgi:hypothetical protein
MKRNVAVLAAVWGGVAVAGIGCNLIVDAGGYAVRDVGADGSSAEAGADGPTAEAALEASSGDAHDAKAPVDAAEAGEAAAVACGQGLPSAADFDQLVESCVLAVSCDPYFFSEPLAFCLTYDGLHRAAAYSCLAGIHSCADFYTCQHVRSATIADCPNATTSAACNGELAVNCSDQGSGTVRDCSILGNSCGTYTDPSSGDLVADCIVDATCTDTDGLDHCSGNSDYTCINGTGYGTNCGSETTCTTVDDVTGCYFNEPSCAVSDSYACNGAQLTFCSDGLQQIVDHCGLSASSCELDDAGVGYCVSPGCTIQSVATCVESCAKNGTTLNTCIGGAPYAIDCTTYGFTACDQAMDTDTGTTYTFCE